MDYAADEAGIDGLALSFFFNQFQEGISDRVFKLFEKNFSPSDKSQLNKNKYSMK